jgi:hypothetical protein
MLDTFGITLPSAEVRADAHRATMLPGPSSLPRRPRPLPAPMVTFVPDAFRPAALRSAR